MRIRVVPTAQEQIRLAVAWWRDNRKAAPQAVAEELRRAFQLLSAQPGAGTRVHHVDSEGLRRLHLSRIDFHLYYRVGATEGTVEVLAFWHARRGSGPPIP